MEVIERFHYLGRFQFWLSLNLPHNVYLCQRGRNLKSSIIMLVLDMPFPYREDRSLSACVAKRALHSKSKPSPSSTYPPTALTNEIVSSPSRKNKIPDHRPGAKHGLAMISINAALAFLLLFSISFEVYISAKPNPLGLRKRAAPENTVVVNDADNYWLVFLLGRNTHASAN